MDNIEPKNKSWDDYYWKMDDDIPVDDDCIEDEPDEPIY